MAFDGITISGITNELREKCLEGRISKIAQPERDELMLTIKTPKEQVRVVLSSNASLPLVYISEENKVSPQTAPGFCMLLRKHIQNGRITDIYQPDFERIIVFEIEHLDEMGDICHKKLIIELMGKYSNIIFTDMENKILDSIKHISGLVSSVREVLPGGQYFVPGADKMNPAKVLKQDIIIALDKQMECYKAIYTSFTGLSPMIAHEICFRANAPEHTSQLSEQDKERLSEVFLDLMKQVESNEISPVIIYDNGQPVEYCMVVPTSYNQENCVHYDSPSQLVCAFYSEREKVGRIRQRSVDLRKIVSTILERDVKKYDLQLKQLKDTEKMEDYRICGELLHTYGYSIEEKAKSATVDNYYTGEKLTIKLNPELTAIENAKSYFAKYGKLKRTKEALTELTVQVKDEIDYLETIMTALDIAEKEEDLAQIKDELIESGFIKKHVSKKKQRFKSQPFHFISSDGFHIYVGKNNIQNEELTFKTATGNDWWFHAKKRPGSHVIVKAENQELPDRTFEEAARLAAHYCKADGTGAVEVDYIQRKHVKKSPGQPAGFVIYHTNYSMLIDGNIEGIERID